MHGPRIALLRIRYNSAQPRYNLLFRAFERDLLPLCVEEGIAATTSSPERPDFKRPI